MFLKELADARRIRNTIIRNIEAASFPSVSEGVLTLPCGVRVCCVECVRVRVCVCVFVCVPVCLYVRMVLE